ncbi:CoB--CoM heterodisulfide reductase iron-sulfur subunit C [uncultured archaeon]|nr:CoB--CoM heterodisulfide reductase iron-sulfur subunit C [uncultured archaeon]
MKNREILACIQCGTCTGSCPSGRYTNLNVRRIVKDSIKKDISSDQELWMCTTCYNCQERCPRGIKITDAILLLRSEAVKKGKILPAHRNVCRFLVETGQAIPLDDKHMEIREKIGMGLPETVCKYPEAREEVKKLLKSTGFFELIKE